MLVTFAKRRKEGLRHLRDLRVRKCLHFTHKLLDERRVVGKVAFGQRRHGTPGNSCFRWMGLRYETHSCSPPLEHLPTSGWKLLDCPWPHLMHMYFPYFTGMVQL